MTKKFLVIKDRNGKPIPKSNVVTQDLNQKKRKYGPLGTARITDDDLLKIQEKLKP